MTKFNKSLFSLIQENYESGDWTRREAREFCLAYLEDTFEFAKMCMDEVPNMSMKDQMTVCIEDILVIRFDSLPISFYIDFS